MAIDGDGDLWAIARNEGGQLGRFGSLICSAPGGDVTDWTCTDDPRKFDSPLVFSHRGEIWLLARRKVANEGRFDLGLTAPRDAQFLAYEAAYWITPKRLGLWRLDRSTRTVNWVADIPAGATRPSPHRLDRAGQHRGLQLQLAHPRRRPALGGGPARPHQHLRHRGHAAVVSRPGAQPAPGPRGPGRPVGRTTEATRTALMDAMERQVVAAGYDGATTRSIAHDAGVQVANLRHHFGSKAGLFAAATDRAMGRAAEVVAGHLDPLGGGRDDTWLRPWSWGRVA